MQADVEGITLRVCDGRGEDEGKQTLVAYAAVCTPYVKPILGRIGAQQESSSETGRVTDCIAHRTRTFSSVFVIE